MENPKPDIFTEKKIKGVKNYNLTSTDQSIVNIIKGGRGAGEGTTDG